jgi:hypothetical protein
MFQRLGSPVPDIATTSSALFVGKASGGSAVQAPQAKARTVIASSDGFLMVA